MAMFAQLHYDEKNSLQSVSDTTANDPSTLRTHRMRDDWKLVTSGASMCAVLLVGAARKHADAV